MTNAPWVPLRGEGGAMLLDRLNDPRELANLAAAPKHAAELATMKALLAKLPEAAK